MGMELAGAIALASASRATLSVFFIFRLAVRRGYLRSDLATSSCFFFMPVHLFFCNSG